MQGFIKMQQSLMNIFFCLKDPPCAHKYDIIYIITFKVNKHIFKIQVNSFHAPKWNTFIPVHHLINTGTIDQVN